MKRCTYFIAYALSNSGQPASFGNIVLEFDGLIDSKEMVRVMQYIVEEALFSLGVTVLSFQLLAE